MYSTLLQKNCTKTDRADFFSFLSLALNKSCDVRNTSQLFIFVRGIMKEFEIMEALTAMHSVKGTTTGSDLFTKVSALMGLG